MIASNAHKIKKIGLTVVLLAALVARFSVCLSLALSFSLFLSPSLSHTHARALSLSCSLVLSLSVRVSRVCVAASVCTPISLWRWRGRGEADELLSLRMQCLVAAFARTGDPNDNGVLCVASRCRNLSATLL